MPEPDVASAKWNQITDTLLNATNKMAFLETSYSNLIEGDGENLESGADEVYVFAVRR